MARRKGRKGRRKSPSPSIAGVAVIVNGAYQFGLTQALGALFNGAGPQVALKKIVDKNVGANAIITNTINTAIPALAVKMARRYVGPIQAGGIRVI